MMIKNFDELINTVKTRPSKTVVIAAAHTETALDAAIMAKRENLAECIMTGDKSFITEYLNKKAEELNRNVIFYLFFALYFALYFWMSLSVRSRWEGAQITAPVERS